MIGVLPIESHENFIAGNDMIHMVSVESYTQGIKVDEQRLKIMEGAKRIVAVSPHPEDMELVAGGFLAAMAKNGSSIKLVVVSDGRKGSKTLGETELAQIRRKEQGDAARILGVGNLQFLGFEDTRVPEAGEPMGPIISEIRGFTPDLVVTVDPYLPYESHPDHVYTGKAVLQAVLLHDYPHIGGGVIKGPAPPVALAATAKPNVVINIDNFIEDKMAALRCHGSQFSEESTLNFVRAVYSAVGRGIRCSYAEPFKLLYQHELHLNIFADS